MLEVRAAGTADEQRVTGEDCAVHQEAHRIVGMARTREDRDLLVAERQVIAVAKPARRHLGPRLARQRYFGPRTCTQLGGPREVVGMRMRLDHEAQT